MLLQQIVSVVGVTCGLTGSRSNSYHILWVAVKRTRETPIHITSQDPLGSEVVGVSVASVS